MAIALSHKPNSIPEGQLVSSAELATRIATIDFSGCAATVVGYGNIGREYVKALGALGVKQIRVCSRSASPLRELESLLGVETVAGGFEYLQCKPRPEELGIVAVPTLSLIAAAEWLVSLGFRHLLIEKPVALSSQEIENLGEKLGGSDVKAKVAYNRVAYPAFLEVRSQAAKEGGVTSCTYAFTEWIRPHWFQRFSAEELARWGVANSLHVISMAHGLIGMPTKWSGYRSGGLTWHPAGSVFVGSGISELGIPFSYHADWGSTGRWSVEVHTRISSYRLCPLEKVLRRTSATSDWEEIPLVTFAPHVKVGFVEQAAAMLDPALKAGIPLVSLRKASELARFAGNIFGYPS